MKEVFDRYVQLYGRNGILVDTNLLLLLMIGRYKRKLITEFKRTKQSFGEDDYDLLELMLDRFQRIITTPQVLTEVNSLSNQLKSCEKLTYYPVFAREIGSLEEVVTPASTIAQSSEFARFGLTDTGILLTARTGNYLVLTIDFDLAVYLNTVSVDALNFSNYRTYFDS